MSFRRLLPLLNRVMVQRVEVPTQTPGGILLPETKNNDVQVASVIATGPGIYEDGKFRETLVKAGDKVLLPSYGGMEIEIDDVKYNIYRDTEIVGTVEQE